MVSGGDCRSSTWLSQLPALAVIEKTSLREGQIVARNRKEIGWAVTTPL